MANLWRLYFGRNFDGGEVSDEQFQTFVSNEIASRFIGLTHFDAQGRVRDSDGNILSERSKVVTLLLEDTEANETAIQEVLGVYQQEFSGSGVAQTINKDVAIAFEVVEDIIENDPTPEIVHGTLPSRKYVPHPTGPNIGWVGSVSITVE
ncbi:MAG: DUF3574 domain-containing protein [Okeania sp. SIO2F4]|uniref:DUF3574 domain-containing protein n=1 Tax=Okeania sp. SIO2F4 TaxID=2607790 RepID=UPI00142A1C20|nr:DUF3574 domain-containing protein [Okeania sp. SIO2F4]NES06102.1 DUF3574 domain-containing protein [Okeania sp. SIO2F4]